MTTEATPKLKLPRFTVEDVMAWGPCEVDYPADVVCDLFGRRKYMTALQALDLDIPVPDIFWAIFRPGVLPSAAQHELACRFAERALQQERKRGREPAEASWNAIAVKRRWLRGEATDTELAAAGDAAWAAARDAAGDATWAAAWAAARDAAGATAWDAAGDAEHKWQVQCVREYLKELGVEEGGER